MSRPDYNVMMIPSWYPTAERPGHGIFVKRHVQAIAGNCRVTVLYFDFFGGVSGQVQVKHSRINDLFDEIIVTLPPKTGLWSSFRNFILAGKYFRKYTAASDFDVIHVHVPYHIGIFLWPWLMFSKSRLLITEHWSGYFKEDGRFDRLSTVTKFLLRRLFAKADRITAVSKALAGAIQIKVAAGKKIDVVPNVINCSISPRPLTTGFERMKTFLFLGNLYNAEKNITGIIEAFALACRERNDIRLIIAGSGIDEQMLRDHCKENGLDTPAVEFRGFVQPERLSQLYAESVCLILNSHFETFSIAAAEALLYGVPVISTKCYGPEEFINENNGMLIDRGDVLQLKEAVLKMAENYTRFDPVMMSEELRKRYCGDVGSTFVNCYESQ